VISPPSQPRALAQLGPNAETGGNHGFLNRVRSILIPSFALLPTIQDKIRAVCARTDPCGGYQATDIPTATAALPGQVLVGIEATRSMQ
jgi:hypothetical protein